ncbi:MAG: hypothetical protein ACRELX_19110, partial [Longimicrobiales bacterium]
MTLHRIGRAEAVSTGAEPPAAGSNAAAFSGPSALLLAACAGLLFGVIEIGLLGIAKFGLHRFTHLNPQIVWLAPLFYATLFMLLTLLLLGLRRVWPRLPLLRVLVWLVVFIGVCGSLFLIVRLHRGAAMLVAGGIATQAARLAPRYRPLVRTVARRALPALALLVAAAGLGLNGSRSLGERLGVASLPAARAGAPYVLLVIWDTVRAANLSVYGFERPT